MKRETRYDYAAAVAMRYQGPTVSKRAGSWTSSAQRLGTTKNTPSSCCEDPSLALRCHRATDVRGCTGLRR